MGVAITGKNFDRNSSVAARNGKYRPFIVQGESIVEIEVVERGIETSKWFFRACRNAAPIEHKSAHGRKDQVPFRSPADLEFQYRGESRSLSASGGRQ